MAELKSVKTLDFKKEFPRKINSVGANGSVYLPKKCTHSIFELFNTESMDREENNNSRHSPANTKLKPKKRRLFQLSSVRTTDGPINYACIHPYGKRIVQAEGNTNVHLKKHSSVDFYTRYTKDIFTTLLDLSWFWVILLTAVVYIGNWVIFGIVYWIFSVSHNDFYNIWTATALNGTAVVEDPCVSQVYDYLSAFLFSLESESTIGYGSRSINTECPFAVISLTAQCVLSAIFDTWVIGMCFMRLARPTSRRKTTLFAKKAVICMRDGKRCLLIRAANLRMSLLIGVSIRAHLITLRDAVDAEISEGHNLIMEQHDVHFKNSKITMLTAPVEYCHIIDDTSPLKDIPIQCYNTRSNWFELVVVMSGTVEATSMTMHAQYSYLSSEIKYGHRYVPIIERSLTNAGYKVDFKYFHDTVPEPKRRTQSNSACERRSRMRREEAKQSLSTEDAEGSPFLQQEKYKPSFKSRKEVLL